MKAKLRLPTGTEVDIEGSAEEVERLLALYSGLEGNPARGAHTRKPIQRKASAGGARKRQGGGPQTLIGELVEKGYFKSKRTIGDIQKKLEEMGHIYALTSLSTPLIRLTRSKNSALRRLKENKQWVYVG